MFALVAVILIVAWLMGYLVFPITSSLIHLLLVVALVSFIWHMFAGRRRV
jgi:hypothetical protein